MIKAKELIGRRIVSLSNGQQIETLNDLIFDYQGNQLLALLVDEGGWFSSAKVIPYQHVKSVGEDAIMVNSPEVIIKAPDDERIRAALENKVHLLGLNLLTTDGKDLGRIADVYFDEETGRVEGYDATGGLFADMTSGRTFVPAPESVQIGKDNAIVPISVHAAMEEQDPGGLKGVVQSVSDSVKGTYENIAEATKERQKEYAIGKTAGGDIALDDGTVIVRQGDTITAQQADRAEQAGKLLALATTATGGTIADAYSGAKERVQEGYEDVKNATAERQKAYVIGKTAGSDISTATGELIVQKGHIITEHQADRAEAVGQLGALTAAATGGALAQGVQNLRQSFDPADPQSALGRRVRHDVRAPGGSIVAGQGQIVTPAIVQRAVHLKVEQQLLAATGLGQDSSSGGSPVAGLSAAVASGASNVTEGAGNLIDKAKAWLGDKREEAETLLQERQDEARKQRVRDALGRPVNRVILAPDDSIILNIGEIVTHKAVELAEQGQVLDILLDSVNKDTPHLDPLASRPEETGQAALESQPVESAPKSGGV